MNDAPARDPDALAAEPDLFRLATRCIEAAGPGYEADSVSVEAGLLNMAGTQMRNWFLELQRPVEASGVARMMLGKDFTGPMLWTLLPVDADGSAVRHRLARLLNSELVEQIVVGSIRQGFHTPLSAT